MLVRVYENSYAPGMVQLRPVSDRQLARIHRSMREGGCPEHMLEEETALLSMEDAASMFGPRFREIEEGYSVTVRMDDWTVYQIYGWQRG